jgi:DNA-binding NarL/FixJ family response regulator
MRQIRVLMVDDHGLMIEAVRLALEREKDIELIGEARRGADVLPEVARRQPDVVLLDIRLPDVDGLEVLAALHARYPQVRVVMLSAIDDPEVAREALRRGATAYLDKQSDPARLAAAIRRASAGGASSPARRTDRHGAAAGLSRREREILSRVAEGRKNGQIAEELFLAEQTIKYHLTNVYRKLGVDGRAGAVRFWFEHGVIDASSSGSELSR